MMGFELEYVWDHIAENAAQATGPSRPANAAEASTAPAHPVISLYDNVTAQRLSSSFGEIKVNIPRAYFAAFDQYNSDVKRNVITDLLAVSAYGDPFGKNEKSGEPYAIIPERYLAYHGPKLLHHEPQAPGDEPDAEMAENRPEENIEEQMARLREWTRELRERQF